MNHMPIYRVSFLYWYISVIWKPNFENEQSPEREQDRAEVIQQED